MSISKEGKLKMVRLEMSKDPQRKIRRDNMSELGIPTWTLAQDALKAGDIERASELFDYGCSEFRQVHDAMAQGTCESLDYIAQTFGEEQVGNVWRSQVLTMASTVRELCAVEVNERVYRIAEVFRGHCGGHTGLGDMTIVEEAERFVLIHDPCGTGGKLRRTGQYGVTKKAYPWSWGKVGVPYFCTHCCIFWELTGIEVCGYPLRIHENVDKPQEPCIQYIYKKPELVPEVYFARLGMERTE